MTSDEEAFLEEILSHPDDDAYRLVFADWLEERGDPRAEFIRVQCELAGDVVHGQRRAELQRRESILLAEHRAEWSRMLDGLVTQPRFQRGLPEHVLMTGPMFLEYGARVVALPTVRYVQLKIVVDVFEQLIASPYLGEVRGLGLRACGLLAGHMRSLEESASLGSLSWLDLGENNLGPKGLQHALAALPEGVTHLLLDHNRFHSRSAEAIASSPVALNLRVLNLASCVVVDAGCAALADSPFLQSLEHLDLSGNADQSGAEIEKITERGALALLESANLESLRWLNLGECEIGIDGARAIAETPGVGRLRHLDLTWCGIGPEGTEALARSPYLGNLETLVLAHNEIGDRGTEALADSASLANVQRLNVFSHYLTDHQREVLAARFGDRVQFEAF